MTSSLSGIRDPQPITNDEVDATTATTVSAGGGEPVDSQPARLAPEAARVKLVSSTAMIVIDIAVLVACGVLGVMLVAGYQGPARVLLTVVFVSVGPGWAVAARVPSRDWIVSGALTLGVSWATCATGAVVMLWLHLWGPVVLFAALASICCMLVGTRLASSLRAQGEAPASPALRPATRSITAPSPAKESRRWLGPADVLPAAAAALWVAALRGIRLRPMNDFGLLPLLPLVYWLAFAVLVGSFVWLLRPGRLSPFRLAVHIVLLIVMLHGTAPMLFPDPRYTWVYAHFGVVDYLLAHGRVNQAVDIYNNWPGFFAVAALVTKVSGARSPMAYATWAPVYFNLLGALSFGFVVSALTPSARKQWLAAFVFLAASWVGEDYFAPQAFAYVLCMLIFGLVIRWCAAPGSGWLQAAERAGQRLVRGRVDPAGSPPGDPGPHLHPALVAALVFTLFTVVVVSHQLSPYMLILGVGLLTIAGLVRPRWMVLGLVAIAVGYLAPHFTYVNRTYGLLNAIGNPFRNSQPRMALGQGSAGRVFVADATRMLSLTMWALAAVGGVRRWRRGLPTIGLLLLTGAPGLAFFALSYGGEAIYRVFLFSLPWTAFLAVEGLAPLDDERWSTAALIRIGLATLGLVALFIPAYFGLESVYQVRPTEVAASEYFYAHAAPGTRLVLAAPNFPARLAANYDEHISRGAPYDPVLFVNPLLSGHLLRAADLGLIDAVVAGDEPDTASAGYLVISTGMKAYCEEYGLAPPGALDDLDHLLSHAARWHTVYRNADAVVFELLPPAVAA